MFMNNTYRVMSKNDEIEYRNNPESFANMTDDVITKRAFNEDALKDYFNTDEYADTEDYVDFENFFYTYYEECDIKDGISAKDLRESVMKLLSNDDNKQYRIAFGYTSSKFEDYSINTRSKEWWKWTQFLNTAHNAKTKRVKKDNITYIMYSIRLKDEAQRLATDEAKRKLLMKEQHLTEEEAEGDINDFT